MNIDSTRMIEEFSNTKIDIARYEETWINIIYSKHKT